MATGRPTEFDRQEVLEKSMELFWTNGYEATSLAALIEEMGSRTAMKDVVKVALTTLK